MQRRTVQDNSVPAPNSRVGYRSPPEATRFKKGVSGNPRGRPKGSLNVATVLARTLREKVAINENGRRRTVTKLEAALKQLVDQAAAGDLRALRHLTALAHDAEAQQNARDTQRQDLGELDRDVIQGILRRFQVTEEQRNSSEGDDPPCR
jgi:hypothetical protein